MREPANNSLYSKQAAAKPSRRVELHRSATVRNSQHSHTQERVHSAAARFCSEASLPTLEDGGKNRRRRRGSPS